MTDYLRNSADVLSRASDAGIEAMLSISSDLDDSARILKLCQPNLEFTRARVFIRPWR